MNFSHKAFTRVELLVVIVIISILIALMFPVIGTLREAARRSTCQSRLLSLGKALQKCESSHGSLPPGSTNPTGPIHNVAQGIEMSWTVHLLPYLDDLDTFQHIDLAAGAYAEKNAQVRCLRIAAFLCPSEAVGPNNLMPPSNYAGCHNDAEAPIAEDNDGVLFLNSHISARDVTHGLQYTIYVGEKLTSVEDLGWMSGTRATLRNTGTPINATGEEQPPNDLYVGGFGSGHRGGANFLFGDVSLRFVSAKIDQQVYQQLGSRADSKLLTKGLKRE